jgi:hypothetical protein
MHMHQLDEEVEALPFLKKETINCAMYYVTMHSELRAIN